MTININFIEDQEKPASEEVIARGLVGVASELRLVDAGILVTMVQNGKEASLSDLVSSSTEMYFRRGALRYALSAHCNVCWEKPPIVGLDMEFSYDSVTAYFRLTIGRDKASVELAHLSVDGGAQTLVDRTKRLEAAMASARIDDPRSDNERSARWPS